MTELRCPFCGARELHEFLFHKTLPPAGVTTPAQQLYLRDNDPQESCEHWQHLHGCRAWLKVVRNPSTGEVRSIELLGGALA